MEEKSVHVDLWSNEPGMIIKNAMIYDFSQ